MKNSVNRALTSEQYRMIQQALSLHQAGRFDEATARYRQLLRVLPDYPLLLTNLGTLALLQGKYEKSVRLLEKSLQVMPDQPAALNSLGNTFDVLQRHEEALHCYERALNLNPDLMDIWCNQGNVFSKLKRHSEALSSYKQALAVNVSFIQAWLGRGNVFNDLKQPQEALASYEQAIVLDPRLAQAWFGHGKALSDLQRPQEAIKSYDRTISLQPDYTQAWCNRGKALSDLKYLEDAMMNYDHAITLDSKFTEIWYNRGNTLGELKRLQEAAESYDRAISLRPDYTEALFNKSLVILMNGKYTEGWPLYEWRWKTEPFTTIASRAFPGTLWLGEKSLNGKTLLIYPEQGLGDYIQFTRYAPMALQAGAAVILEVPTALMPLMATLPGHFHLIPQGQPLPDADYHCPVMSLPLAFRTSLDTIPASIPYLFSDATKCTAWKPHSGKPPVFRVGLVWSGSSVHKNDHNRSIPLQQLEFLLTLPCEFHSLQQDIRPQDAAFIRSSGRIHNHQHRLHDFSDTAALTAAMDLVISVDTSVAHLAGAMGKTLWLLLPWIPDYRWMLDRQDTPWYPSATLFRQPAPGDWQSVILTLRQHLALLHEESTFNDCTDVPDAIMMPCEHKI